MIQIPRALARQFRSLLRRARLGKQPDRPDAFVQFVAGEEGLRIRAASHQVGIEYRLAGAFAPEEFFVPVDLLETVEGPKQDAVTLELQGGKRVTAHWTDRGVPQSLSRNAASPKTLTWPDLPANYAVQPPALWTALREAVATTDPSPTRYVLNCVQLRGSRGDLVATDGRHILVQAGYQWPWTDEVLVEPHGLLGVRELGGESVAVGHAGEWVSFKLGPWFISLRKAEGRFPKVDDCIPNVEMAKSHLAITAADAGFLDHSLPGLPTDNESEQPVTLDLNGRVVVRGKGPEQTTPTELVLSNSRLAGEPIVLSTNRRYLTRAIQLGFRELHFTGQESPVVCRDEQRRFVWAILGKGAITPSQDDAITMASPEETPEQLSTVPIRRRNTMPEQTSAPVASIKPQSREPKPQRPRTGSPIEQAAAMRDALRVAAVQANDLLRSLKHQRRQSRIVETTLASLKQLQKVAG